MKKTAFFLLAWQLILSGCASSHFSLVDPEYIFKSDRIAVVSGLDDEVSNYLAAELSKELNAKTTFKVMPAEEIIRRVPGYPMKIQGPYSASYFGIDEDYTRTDKNRIKKIMSKLDVDYLYVLWAPSVVQSSNSIEIYIITQLFEIPSFRDIAHSSYYIKYTAGDAFSIYRPVKNHISNATKKAVSIGGSKNMEDAVRDTAERAVKEIIEATGKGKPGR